MTDAQPVPVSGKAAEIVPDADRKVFGALIGVTLCCFALQGFFSDDLLHAVVSLVGGANLLHVFFLALQLAALVSLRVATLLYLKRCVRRLLRLFDRASDRGTSWFPEIKGDGHSQMNKVTGLREQVRWIVGAFQGAWWLAAGFALVAGAAVVFAAWHHMLGLATAVWLLLACLEALFVSGLTVLRIHRDFSDLRPRDDEIEAAAELQLKSDREQKEEIVAIARRG